MGALHWIVGAGLLVAPALADNFQEANTQRWGADYARLAMTQQNAEDCARACATDSHCRAWTFVKAGVEGRAAACHLKSAVPHGRPDPCCTSGVAKESTPPRELARVEPRARTSSNVAGDSSDATGASMVPDGMTGATSGSDLVPGAVPQQPQAQTPAMAPVSSPVTSPATSGPINLTPQSWDNQE
jgi:PAN domain